MKYKLTIDLTINDEWATGDKSVDLELFEDMIQSFNEKFVDSPTRYDNAYNIIVAYQSILDITKKEDILVVLKVRFTYFNFITSRELY